MHVCEQKPAKITIFASGSATARSSVAVASCSLHGGAAEHRREVRDFRFRSRTRHLHGGLQPCCVFAPCEPCCHVHRYVCSRMTLVHFGRCARRGQFRPPISAVFEFVAGAKVCRRASGIPKLSPTCLGSLLNSRVRRRYQHPRRQHPRGHRPRRQRSRRQHSRRPSPPRPLRRRGG